MNIFFSGIGGVGIGPLALIAKNAGYHVQGSDQAESTLTRELIGHGVAVSYDQTGHFLAKCHKTRPIDWLVYSAALPENHPELVLAREHGIKTTKRDEFLGHILTEKNLKLLAVSGTHGKTTTTSMLVWTLNQLEMPVSYSIGTTLTFGPSGQYVPDSTYFAYECDEFDRNMLHFWPYLSIITSLDHDHVDTYPTDADYRAAFVTFLEQSDMNVLWEKDLRYLAADPRADLEAYDDFMDLSLFSLTGLHNRRNAYLVLRAVQRLLPDVQQNKIVDALNRFPGSARRMEKLANNLYSDYAHHPVEIQATLDAARELSDDIVVVYQPHQNTRQHELQQSYTSCFTKAKKVYWLPTYLSREANDLPILSPKELTQNLSHSNIAIAELDDTLWNNISKERTNGAIVVVMGAGSIDSWLRQRLST